MTRRIINFSFSFMLIACISMIFASCVKEETPPKGTLPEEEMADILADIHIAESRVTRLQLKSLDSSILIFDKLKQEVWKKYKVDTLVYRNSYSFYMTHPVYMTRIYKNVSKKLKTAKKQKI